MRFSDRTNWDIGESDHAAAVRAAREGCMGRGDPWLDLTMANPTACGFHYDPQALLRPLSDASALQYTPEPFGMTVAREAVARYYADHGAALSPERICLTTSTSEAYSFLFRLLCNPGDEVMAARPSYPLFDYIAQLDDVHLLDYALLCDPNAAGDGHAAWSIDLYGLEAAITGRTRAVLLVHPNNPTGSYALEHERAALQQICARHELALIVDEVFLDYELKPGRPGSFAAGESPCLTFVLSGLSKICALPQMKCSWIVAYGPGALVNEAVGRLEVIADTYLSMNAPVQHALPAWLAGRSPLQQQILARMQANLAVLEERLRGTQSQRLPVQGGWTVVLRVPRTVDGLPFAEAALARDVLVQPGDFYGLPEGRIVLSLLTPPEIWSQGLARLPFG